MIDIWVQKVIKFHQGNIKIIKGAQRIHRQTRIERNKYAMDIVRHRGTQIHSGLGF